MRAQPGFDLLVFGDGPAGLACGLAGLAAGLSVALAGRSGPRERLPVGEHIASRARASLERLGGTLPAGTVIDCPLIEAHWGSDQPNVTDYLFSPFGSGMNVLRPAFDLTLLRSFADRGGRLLGAVRPLCIRRRRGRFEVEIEDGSRLATSWLIDATGRACALARRLGAKLIAYDRLIGLVADVHAEAPRSAGLVVEANESGWCYAVGLAGGGTRVVALTDSDLARRAGDVDDLWCHLVSSGPALRHFGRAVPRRIEMVPARTQRLERAGGEGWLAVGDAAMAFDPLASDGIAKALEDGLDAAAAIVEGPDGLHRRKARIEASFREYCQEHRACYGLERRWPDRAFWRRRHAGPLGTQPIVLDPKIRLQRAAADGCDDGRQPFDCRIWFPLVDPEPVLRIATRPQPAHALVRAVGALPALRGLTDRELIGLMQTLISVGALRIIEPDGSVRFAAI